MGKIVTNKLNRYMIEMVKPDKCIRSYGHFPEFITAAHCNMCFFCDGTNEDECKYEIITVDLARGKYETNYDKPRNNYFEQFCCPECGELIVQDSLYMIEWRYCRHGDINCNHCGAMFVCLDESYPKNKLTLARKVKE